MGIFITILHIIVALALIFIVLLQTGKGSSMGAAFGGGSSSTVFGSRGPASFLSKITAVAAIVFMFTSLGLSLFHENRIGGGSLMEGVSVPVQEDIVDTTAPAEPVQTEPDIPADTAQPIQSEN
jgi:preprotein translocase subunit SecG